MPNLVVIGEGIEPGVKNGKIAHVVGGTTLVKKTLPNAEKRRGGEANVIASSSVGHNHKAPLSYTQLSVGIPSLIVVHKSQYLGDEHVGLFLGSQLCGQKPNTLKPARLGPMVSPKRVFHLFFTLPHSAHFAFTKEGIGIAVSQHYQPWFLPNPQTATTPTIHSHEDRE
ncbi:hypothetical protein CR513_37638, partial [Mucuna pruriens]